VERGGISTFLCLYAYVHTVLSLLPVSFSSAAQSSGVIRVGRFLNNRRRWLRKRKSRIEEGLVSGAGALLWFRSSSCGAGQLGIFSSIFILGTTRNLLRVCTQAAGTLTRSRHCSAQANRSLEAGGGRERRSPRRSAHGVWRSLPTCDL